jgi:hypothetical protein
VLFDIIGGPQDRLHGHTFPEAWRTPWCPAKNRLSTSHHCWWMSPIQR